MAGGTKSDDFGLVATLTVDGSLNMNILVGDGTKSFRDQLIEGNMLLARQVAQAESRGGQEYEELEATGYLALVQVADEFDPAKGGDFKVFAGKRIRQEVNREAKRLRGHDRHRGHEEFVDEETVVSKDPHACEGPRQTPGIWRHGTQERVAGAQRAG